MQCSLAFLVNPGRIPWFVVSRVLSAHASMLENQVAYMIKNKERLLQLWESEIKFKVETIKN